MVPPLQFLDISIRYKRQAHRITQCRAYASPLWRNHVLWSEYAPIMASGTYLKDR